MGAEIRAAGGGAGRRLAARWLPALVLFLASLGLWQVLVDAMNVRRYVLPSPADIGGVIAEDWARLLRHVGWTMVEAVGGFALGSAAAFVAAVMFVHVRMVERAMYPWAIILQTVPVIAIAPLLTIWLGFGIAPKVVIAAIVCFFPVLVNTTRGLRAASPETMELMQILSASRWQVFRRVRVITALPFLMAALKIAATLSAIGAIVGEFTGADRGIGYVVVSAGYRLDAPELFAGIAFSCLAAVLFFGAVTALERAVLYWPGARAGA